MNSSGILLVVAGAWVVTQVIAGQALERLGVRGDLTTSSSGTTSGSTGGAAPVSSGSSGSSSRTAVGTVGNGSWYV